MINDVIDEHLQAATTHRVTSRPPTMIARRPAAEESVDDWLTQLKMSRYRENFARCGYTHLAQLTQLTRHELTTQLGVSLVGHQKKILDGVQALQTAFADDDNRTNPRPNDPLLV